MYYTVNYLAPEKLTIPYHMLSDYCKKIPDEYWIKVVDVKKLIPNLGGKTNYVLHYRNWLKFIKVLKFKQSDWMKKYIDFSTKKRMGAANSFEKDFFKLMINSVFLAKQFKICKKVSMSE